VYIARGIDADQIYESYLGHIKPQNATFHTPLAKQQQEVPEYTKQAKRSQPMTPKLESCLFYLQVLQYPEAA